MGTPLRVLIVEDCEDDELLVSRELRKGGYDVTCQRVETSEQMAHALRTQSWDVIISDYCLPNFSAEAALVVAREVRPDLPFIIVSGTVGETTAVSAMKAGAHDFLTKDRLVRLPAAVERELREAGVRRDHRRAEERLQGTFERSALGKAMISCDENFLRVNNALATLLDYPREELERLNLSDVGLPANAESTSQPGAQPSDNANSRRLEQRCLRKDGTVVWVDASISMIPDAEGGSQYFIWEFVDITQRKRAEEEKRQMQAALAQADRLSSMGMLAAGVAHEINNPLSYILYNLDCLADELPDVTQQVGRLRHALVRHMGEDALRKVAGSSINALDPEPWTDIVERFHDALDGTRKIKDIARGLGAFSRVESERRGSVQLQDPIESALAIASNEIKYRARVEKDLRFTSPVMGSEGKLSQVFLNLLINAAHAIAEGHVDDNSIRVRTWEEGGFVLAEVSDSGSGIAPDHLPHIFEPFFTTKPVGVGSGLGLSIVKNIISSFGGSIEVSSERGRGTSFLIRLPAATNAQTDGDDAKGPQMGEWVAGRILIVDDERGIRDALKRILKGHQIIEAESGEQARDLLIEDQQFDVVLCDMMMPSVSGADLHRWIVAHCPLLAPRVVFVTGGAFTPSAREYLGTLENLRIDKPFNAAQTRRIVGEMVRAAKTERGNEFGD